jgi:hypothetical protein
MRQDATKLLNRCDAAFERLVERFSHINGRVGDVPDEMVLASAAIIIGDQQKRMIRTTGDFTPISLLTPLPLLSTRILFTRFSIGT